MSDVIDDPTRDLLQECVRRESRSLLQYTREVPLWAGPADRPALAKLKALATAEQAATDALGHYLQKQKVGVPSLGPYPSSFTTLNDSALHHLLPILVAEYRGAIGALEANLARVTDPDARSQLAALFSLKQQHLPELEALTSQPHTTWK
jgi:hypothetical protein